MLTCYILLTFTFLLAFFSAVLLSIKHMYIYFCLPTRKNHRYSRLGREDSLAEKSAEFEEPTFDLNMWSITKLGVILSYFYVSDRTNYLLKENK